MANTFTTNYGLTKSEIGANNDNWGTDLNNALSSVDTQLNRKVDKADIATQTSNKIAFSGSTITANSTTASTIFENFKAGDVISIAGAVSANNGNHTISSKTNAYTLVTSSSFQTEAEGANTVSYHLVPKFSEVDIDGGTIDGATIGGATIGGATIATSNITVGSSKTLDVSAGTLTTSTAQKDAIVDGSTAITRSSNDIAIAGDLTVTGGDIKSSGGTTAISVSGANTTLAGTGNNIGTVTAGTINDTVSIVGTPRNTTIKKYSDANSIRSTTTTEKAFTDSISFACQSGKTYVFSATGTAQLSETTFTTSTDTEGYIYLKHHSSSVSQDASSPSGTLMNACTLKISPPDGMIQLPFHILGVFECTTNATKHFYVSYKSKNAQSYMTMVEGRNSSGVIIMLQEYDTDNYTVT